MTAFVTGTASNAADLWSKLIAFLTTNGDLTAAAQNWTQVWSGTANDVVLRGPGMAGQDQVFVGLQRIDRPSSDEFEIQINGMTGILSGAANIKGHIGALPLPVRIFLDSNPMRYWFVASGRRFVVVVKISTVYQSAYAGLFLPYANPTQYGYPMFIGGMAGQPSIYYPLSSWRSTVDGHRAFMNSFWSEAYESSAWMLSPQGEWLRTVSIGRDGAAAVAPRRFYQTGLGTVVENRETTRYGTMSQLERQRGAFGGEMLLTPHTLLSNVPNDQTWGILDGTYHVPGFGNAAENTITVDGVDHLVVQDGFRTGRTDYWAVRLA